MMWVEPSYGEEYLNYRTIQKSKYQCHLLEPSLSNSQNLTYILPTVYQ